MMQSPAETLEHRWEKVVVHCEEGIVKGFLQIEGQLGRALEDALEMSSEPPTVLRVQRLGATSIDEIPIGNTKAVFFVHEFEGNSVHKDLRFYRGAAIGHGIWIRMEFVDGEIMEGLVYNSLRFLVEPGFLMRPTDPNSNNRLAYVMKSSVRECRILGLRNI